MHTKHITWTKTFNRSAWDCFGRMWRGIWWLPNISRHNKINSHSLQRPMAGGKQTKRNVDTIRWKCWRIQRNNQFHSPFSVGCQTKRTTEKQHLPNKSAKFYRRQDKKNIKYEICIFTFFFRSLEWTKKINCRCYFSP